MGRGQLTDFRRPGKASFSNPWKNAREIFQGLERYGARAFRSGRGKPKELLFQ
jgi:hypothetical protein